jgi:hypothetical protein
MLFCTKKIVSALPKKFVRLAWRPKRIGSLKRSKSERTKIALQTPDPWGVWAAVTISVFKQAIIIIISKLELQ